MQVDDRMSRLGELDKPVLQRPLALFDQPAILANRIVRALDVLVHDFMDKELGKAIPYGVYDVTENQGWVSVGIDHDTARFATEAMRRW